MGMVAVARGVGRPYAHRRRKRIVRESKHGRIYCGACVLLVPHGAAAYERSIGILPPVILSGLHRLPHAGGHLGDGAVDVAKPFYFFWLKSKKDFPKFFDPLSAMPNCLENSFALVEAGTRCSLPSICFLMSCPMCMPFPAFGCHRLPGMADVLMFALR